MESSNMLARFTRKQKHLQKEWPPSFVLAVDVDMPVENDCPFVYLLPFLTRYRHTIIEFETDKS
jgi:hypothetical protein